MLVETVELSRGSKITLTAYIPDVSPEMPYIKERSAVMIIPGGAYKCCSDREAEPVALEFLSRGYNSFVLRYSLNEDAAFPKPLEDAVEAYNLIVKNREKWHTDINRIAVCGFSAGGHLAAALTNMTDVKLFACILGYPCIYDDISPILAKPIESVDKYVSDSTPPTFIFAASNDRTVPVEHSLKYSLKLNEYNVPFEMHIFNNGDHGFSTAKKTVIGDEKAVERLRSTASWIDLCTAWLEKIK